MEVTMQLMKGWEFNIECIFKQDCSIPHSCASTALKCKMTALRSYT